MKFIKKIFLLFLIIFVLYIVWLFAFTEKTKSFWDEIWLKGFNEFILQFKWKVDEISNLDAKKTLENIWSWTTNLLDNAWNYAKEIKWKIDSVRSTAQWVENTYNEVKTQIDETTKNLKEIWEKVNEAKETINKTINISN